MAQFLIRRQQARTPWEWRTTRGAKAIEPESISFSRRHALRISAWGTLALLAVAAAYLAARSEIGTQRIAGVIERKPAETVRQAPAIERPFDAEIEARRLQEAVRLLAADRDRLLARINTLERSLDDVTGSVNPAAPAPAAPSATPAPPSPSGSPLPQSFGTGAPQPTPAQLAPEPLNRQAPEPQPRAALEPIPPAAAPPAQAVPPTNAARPPAEPPAAAAKPQPAPRAGQPAPPNRAAGGQAAIQPGPGAAESVVTRTDFGIDLGSHTTVEGLRALWTSLRTTHGALFEGLRPLMSVREGKRPGEIELRLVAGPLGNAGAAARLCAALAAAGKACQPAVYDGQRLALQ